MTEIIDALKWRYACKLFDTTKKVSKSDLDEIIDAFILTSSGFWLQPWKLLVIEKQSIKDSLVEHSWGQSQISDCSHLLVLCRVANLDESSMDKHLDNIWKVREVSKESLSWYEQRVKWFFLTISEDNKSIWSANQVFIALWNLLTVLAMKKIDSCTIWWFIPEKYDEILNLKQKWLASVVALPIWYRSKEDKYANAKKVRFSREEVVEII